MLFNLVKEQIKRGHQVKVLVYDHDKRWCEKFRAIGAQVVDDYIKAPGYDLKLLKWITDEIKDQDMVHTHDLNPMLYVGVLKILNTLKMDSKIKLAHTTHGMEHIKTHPKTRYYEFFLGLCAQRIIPVSPDFERYYKKQFLTNNNKITLIENGTDLPAKAGVLPVSRYKRKLCETYDLDYKRGLGVYIGRVTPLKGQLDLARFYKKVNRQILFVGPASDEGYFQDCLKLQDRNIKFTGPREDISDILKGCDYFISNSKHEGLPIAALEAGAHELPCILSDIPGHAQFNTFYKCVELFKSMEELETLLSKSEKNSKLLLSLAQNFRELISLRYSSDAMAQRYQIIYEDMFC